MAVRYMQRAVQLTAWLLACAITVLSLSPASLRPVTVVPHDLEHLGIFLAMGLAFGAGYFSRPWAVFGGLLIFSGVIEIAQLFVPGRHARITDFVFDAGAACVGAGLAYGAAHVRRCVPG